MAGISWADLKLSAMDASYLLTDSYTTLIADDKDLLDALIAAQTAQGGEDTLVSTFVSTDLTDTTVIGDTTWADLRFTAMTVGFQMTTTYTDLTAEDSALVDALIAAQTTQGYSEDLLGASPYTTGNDYTDLTTVAGISWADLKLSAMDASYLLTDSYTTLVADDKDLFDALFEAQTAQGNEEILVSTIESTYLTDTTVIGDTTWGDFRSAAMVVGFQTTTSYTDLTAEDSALVDALIAAQTDQANSDVLLGGSPYTTGLDYTDMTTVGGKTW